MSFPAFTAAPDAAFEGARKVVRKVQELEKASFLQGDPKSPTLPWMPYQPADFMAVMFDVSAEARGRHFLDVGCGPGTKMALASCFYGMEAFGIEIDPKMAATAEKGYPGHVVCGDAADFPGYGFYDVIWLYRPFRDPELEDQLERKVSVEMKPGAILAGGAWENCPAAWGWGTVVDDWELRRGAWQKPW